MCMQVLKEQEGSISIKELSAATMIKTEDIISTLQHLNLIQYQKGQHVICAAPAVIERHLKQAGSPGLQVPPRTLFSFSLFVPRAVHSPVALTVAPCPASPPVRPSLCMRPLSAASGAGCIFSKCRAPYLRNAFCGAGGPQVHCLVSLLS